MAGRVENYLAEMAGRVNIVEKFREEITPA
jgi:hypothetical protein